MPALHPAEDRVAVGGRRRGRARSHAEHSPGASRAGPLSVVWRGEDGPLHRQHVAFPLITARRRRLSPRHAPSYTSTDTARVSRSQPRPRRHRGDRRTRRGLGRDRPSSRGRKRGSARRRADTAARRHSGRIRVSRVHAPCALSSHDGHSPAQETCQRIGGRSSVGRQPPAAVGRYSATASRGVPPTDFRCDTGTVTVKRAPWPLPSLAACTVPP